jgi:hypothetical protein
MYKYILESAGDINWMAISALITFFTVFMVSIVLVLRTNKDYIDKMAHLPLEDDTYNVNSETESHYEK